jgi:deazaflavin-dependent oxidoreductase (nitroreductase family)
MKVTADTAPGEASDSNTKIIDEFRANGGRISGPLAGTPMILIHHIGAKSGTVRITPLACNPQPDGRLAIVASNGGSPAHPDWYHNLKANPVITVEMGSQTFSARAEELDAAARAELWPNLVAESPAIGEHQGKTTRQIPVFVLIRQDRPAARAAWPQSVDPRACPASAARAGEGHEHGHSVDERPDRAVLGRR